MGDGTQIWKITHNGVDTHSIHFHLFNVQLLYSLWLGTTGVGSHDLYNPPAMSGLSTTVSGLPITGKTIYARMYSWINGAWQGTDYTYIAQ